MRRKTRRTKELQKYISESNTLYESVPNRKRNKNPKKDKGKQSRRSKNKTPRFTVEILPEKFSDRPMVLFLDPPYPAVHPAPVDL